MHTHSFSLGLFSLLALSATLADRAFDGVRAHYTIAQSAVRQIEVYESAVRRARGLPC